MNIKHILSVTALAFATTSAFASEATQFSGMGGNLSRAEVKADLSRALADGHINRVAELHGSFDQIGAGIRDRADVREEARMAAHSNTFSPLYDGA